MDINEAKMSPATLKAEASKIDAKVGIEFELIVKDVGGSSAAESEADYDTDEYISDRNWSSFSRDIQNFFIGDYNSRRTVNDEIDSAEENYNNWAEEKWEDYVKDTYKDWRDENYPDNDDPDVGTEEDYKNEQFEDFKEQGDGSIEAWLADIGMTVMSDFANEHGLDWPNWTEEEEPMAYGNRSLEEIADSFKKAVGIDVNISTDYHSAPRGGDAYLIEPDSSLRPSDSDDAGLEFVSPPLGLEQALNQLEYVKKWAADDNAYTNKSCGLHMNVSIPGYDLDKLDYIKLAVFLGDEYVSSEFGRLGNTYAESAMEIIKRNIQRSPEVIPAVIEKIKNKLMLDASKLIHSGRTGKYTSINTKDNRVELRSPGGNWLDMDLETVSNTLMRFVVALDIAMDPKKYQKEYSSRLYRLLSPKKTDDTIALFAMYKAGEITAEQLKNSWSRAVLAAGEKKKVSPGKAAVAAKIATREKPYRMIRDRDGNIMTMFMATSEQDAIDQGNRWIKANDIFAPSGNWWHVELDTDNANATNR